MYCLAPWQGPRKTFPGDSNDVADLAQRVSTGNRSGTVIYGNGPYGTRLTGFNGVSGNWATTPASRVFDNLTVFSLEAVVVINASTGNYQAFLSFAHDVVYSGCGIGVEPSGKAHVVLGKANTASTDLAGTSTLAIGSPVHVEATYDGTTLRVYVNGTLENSVATTYGPTSGAGVTIGRWYPNTDNYYLNGSVIHGAVYDYAQSADLVAKNNADFFWRFRDLRAAAPWLSAAASVSVSFAGIAQSAAGLFSAGISMGCSLASAAQNALASFTGGESSPVVLGAASGQPAVSLTASESQAAALGAQAQPSAVSLAVGESQTAVLGASSGTAAASFSTAPGIFLTFAASAGPSTFATIVGLQTAIVLASAASPAIAGMAGSWPVSVRNFAYHVTPAISPGLLDVSAAVITIAAAARSDASSTKVTPL